MGEKEREPSWEDARLAKRVEDIIRRNIPLNPVCSKCGYDHDADDCVLDPKHFRVEWRVMVDKVIKEVRDAS